jgi:hypothetical protein
MFKKLIKNLIAFLPYIGMIAIIVTNTICSYQSFLIDMVFMRIIGTLALFTSIGLTIVVVKHGYQDIKNYFSKN